MALSNNKENTKKATEKKGGASKKVENAPVEESDKNVTKNDTSTKKQEENNARKRTLEEPSNDKDGAKRGRSEDAVEMISEKEKFVDKAVELGFKAGDRLEVEWAVGNKQTKTHWKATLLEHDGRTKEGFAIRVLDYDPLPEFGFPKKSQEDAVFITEYILVNPASGESLNFRREGADEIVDFHEDDLNDMLSNVLNKNSAAMNKLTPAQQAHVGDIVATGKERLLDAIQRRWEEQPGRIITSEEVPDILEQAFQGM